MVRTAHLMPRNLLGGAIHGTETGIILLDVVRTVDDFDFDV